MGSSSRRLTQMTASRQARPRHQPSSSQASDNQQTEGLVLERVQPKRDSHEVSTDQVDYLDVTIKQDKHGGTVSCMTRKMRCQDRQGDDELPTLEQN